MQGGGNGERCWLALRGRASHALVAVALTTLACGATHRPYGGHDGAGTSGAAGDGTDANGGTGATSANGGTGATSANGGTGANDSNGGTGANDSTGGTSPNGGTDPNGNAGEGGADETAMICSAGERRCNGIVPQACMGNVWVSEMPCASSCTGEGSCQCQAGARRCEGAIPQVCENGAFVDDQPCGAAQACTGSGVCASFRLLNAGLSTLGIPAPQTSTAPLTQHSFSAVPSLCDTRYCLTGDIR